MAAGQHPAWWLGLLVLFAGVGTLAFGLCSVVVDATGYAGPAWWLHATGRDTSDRRSPGA